MADSLVPAAPATSAPPSTSPAPPTASSSDGAVPSSASSSSSLTSTPALSNPTSPAKPAENHAVTGHKRELDEKSTEELVEIEKKKVRTIQTLVEEVKKDTTSLNELIAEAKESKDVEERKEMIDEIKHAAADMEEKVHTAAALNADVKEITTVLKEKTALSLVEDNE